MKDFAAFIVTHGRPDNVVTITSLRNYGYTGPIYLIVDDEDSTLDAYQNQYGDMVKVFSKEEISGSFDIADNFPDKRSVVYARNASFEIARDLGIKYFLLLDDDYTSFQYRFDDNYSYAPKTLKNLDTVFAALLKFFINSGADTVTLAQGGDFIGGTESSYAVKVELRRKAMNSFFLSPDRPFKFEGRINEDVVIYTYLASKGLLCFMANQVNLNQNQTQKNSGGMTELYLDRGTYVKSFYSVMFQPSSVKIGLLITKFTRLHHVVNWNRTVPKILREELKK